jgi:hypothetical protein
VPNYDFVKDFPIARETEKEIAERLSSFYGWKILEVGKTNAYDLKIESMTGKVFTVEIKEDFSCYKTGNIGVEFECRGKPSGISVSQADYYIYKVHTPLGGAVDYRWIRTSKLKSIIADETIERRIVSGGDKDSNSMNYLFRYYGTFFPKSTRLFEEI